MLSKLAHNVQDNYYIVSQGILVCCCYCVGSIDCKRDAHAIVGDAAYTWNSYYLLLFE